MNEYSYTIRTDDGDKFIDVVSGTVFADSKLDAEQYLSGIHKNKDFIIVIH